MSDLSQPPLTLIPLDAAPGPGRDEPPAALDPALLDTVPAALDAPAPPAPTFVWPALRLPGYPDTGESVVGQPCVVEGLNGRTTAGRLMRLDLRAGLLLLAVPPSKSLLTLRLDQFRCLRLTQPLQRQAAGAGAAGWPELVGAPVLSYEARLRGGAALAGKTFAPRECEAGLFVFEPIDEGGRVRRAFVPRAACEQLAVGPRLGEALVQEQLATPAQIDTALAEQQQLRHQRLGEMLVVQQIITAEALDEAIAAQARMPMVRIGEALTALGFISEGQLAEALEQQKSDRSIPLGELLVRKGLVSRRDLQMALARKMGYPLVDVLQFPAEADAVQRIPYAMAQRLCALPLLLRGGRLVVALEDPTRKDTLQELEFTAQAKVLPVLARGGALPAALERAYERLGGIDYGSGAARPAGARAPGGDAGGAEFDLEDAGQLLATLERQQPGGDGRGGDDDDAAIEQSDNSLVRLINSMILEAQAQGVSDIHIESQPGREKVRIRFRKDGQMRPYLELPHTYRSAMIARLKIMCDLDISERRKPQDGKITFGKFVQGVRLELRVATIPTHSGLEDAVLRLLASAKPLPLDKLNLTPDNFRRLQHAIERPYGMVLCVGPTGSGKTTTLHSALGWINTPERKIWTAEDPIEITQAGLRQVQVNPKIDWTFAKALRSFLRADPDVVMVGEIRDRETAQVAIEASLTGHLVMSTLHTNSAPETVTRLLDMGMDPFNFADALLAVLAQRLVRRLCPDCRSVREATDDEVEELLHDHQHAMGSAPGVPGRDAVLADWMARFGTPAGRLRLHQRGGCAKCDQTGLRGRAGIHELMTVSRSVRHLIQTGARAEELQQQALADGMRTLRQDGIEKVLQGVTTLDEVRAVTN